jgi:hypothetical protein
MSRFLRSALPLLIGVALLVPAAPSAAAGDGHAAPKAGKPAAKHAKSAKRRKAARRARRRAAQLHQARRSVGNAVAVAGRPAAQPSPSTVSSVRSGLAFSGRHVSDFWLDHSAPTAISEVADPAGSGETVMKMDVSDQDVYPVTPTENPRAELLSPPLLQAGQEVWLATKFLVPSDYPTIPKGGWVSLVSFYGAPFDGPSPWRIELAGDNMQWQRNGTYDYDVPWQAPLERDRWNTVLVHERFAADGFVEMWVNGQQITFFSSGGYNPSSVSPTTQLSMATMDGSNGAGANSAKIMQYREAGMFGSGSIYFGPLLLGESRAAVEA